MACCHFTCTPCTSPTRGRSFGWGVLQVACILGWPHRVALMTYVRRWTAWADWRRYLSCCVCTEMYLWPFVSMLVCQQGHFIDLECLDHMLQCMVSDPDLHAIRCPTCQAPYNEDQLLRSLKHDRLKDLMVLQRRSGEQERAAADAAGARRREQLEQLPIEVAYQRTLDLMTLSCPACKRAFVDFQGCLALQCGCDAWLCGWCLVQCESGRSAHLHVASCAAGPGNYYGSLEEFNQHHRQRKRRLVEQHFAALPRYARASIVQRLRMPLGELGIRA